MIRNSALHHDNTYVQDDRIPFSIRKPDPIGSGRHGRQKQSHYTNGLIAYAREILARTEQYWCPIKHAHKVLGTHDRYALFLDYGDAEECHRKLEALREAIRQQSAVGRR